MRRRDILGGAALFAAEPESYWNRVRRERFLLPDWRAFLNNGSLGIATFLQECRQAPVIGIREQTN